MAIKMEAFGRTRDGDEVLSFSFLNKNGLEAVVLGYGGILQSVKVPDGRGAPVDVCLGFGSVEKYEEYGTYYIGAMIGRYANRIGGGRFTLGGTDYQLALNDGANHLHGGIRGFDKQNYKHDIQGDTLLLSRRSPDGEENYPGNLDVTFSYRLTDDGQLELGYDALSDADTLASLTNHAYFNLSGEGSGSILDHRLTIDADIYSANDSTCLVTEGLLPVDGTPFDFRKGKTIGEDISSPDAQLANCGGYDHNFVLNTGKPPGPAATLASPQSGISMKMFTTKPCIQFYSGNYLAGAMGKSGIYDRQTGLCLEAQYRPNTFDEPADNPSPFLKKGEPYRHKTVYQFSNTK